MKKLLILGFAFCILGCKSTATNKTEIVEVDPNLPEWLEERAPYDEIWGIGSAFEVKDFEAMIKAEELARASIREQIALFADAMFNSYEQDYPDLAPYIKTNIAYKIGELPLKDAEVNLRWQAPNMTWWYRLSCKKEALRFVLFDLLEAEVEEYPDFNPNIAISYFDEQDTTAQPPIQSN